MPKEAFIKGEEFVNVKRTKRIVIREVEGPHILFTREVYDPVEKRWYAEIDPDTKGPLRALFDSELGQVIQALNPTYIVEMNKRRFYNEDRKG